MTQQIEDEYNKELMTIKVNDPFADAKRQYIGQKRERKFDVLISHAPKSKRKKNARDSDEKTEDFLSNQDTKIIIDFDCETSTSINSLAVNKTNVVKLTTSFFSGKMLMFAKLSLMSFKYEMLETFYFPNDKTKIIYNFYGIETTLPYHVLTDTDSTAFVLLFCVLQTILYQVTDSTT